MTLYQSLLKSFGKNEPIMIGEITFGNYSRPWIYKELNRLCKENKLIRYEKGIYYIPKQTVLGPSLLNPKSVIEKKYIKNGNNTIGYYSGYTLMNQLKLTEQVSNIIELYTNNETSNIREVKVGNQKVQLRKARIAINDSNAAVLCFLELMNTLPRCILDDRKKQILGGYISDNNITRRNITEYAPAFPDRAMRNLVESEVIYSVTQ